jgi:hypothetical protein
MLLTITACALALLTQDKAAQAAAKPAEKAAPAIDRSAEPALRQVFAASGSLRNVHIQTELYNREPDSSRWDDDSSADFWIGDGMRFRYASTSNFWGGGSTFVCDGESLLSDDMSDDGAIRISQAKKTLHEVNDQEALFYLLEGPAGFDAVVDKDKPVKFIGAADAPERVVELTTKKFGVVQVHYSAGSGLPTCIEVMRAPWYSDDDNPYPDQPFSREDIKIVSRGPQNQSLFSVVPPKGKKFTDERTKKG